MLPIVRRVCIVSVAALPVTLADSLSYWEQQGIININFDEPVVSRAVVEKQADASCSEAEKGLDLFSISGDDAHQPRVIWVEQDCLRIEPAPGSSVQTEYTLRFRPDARYLSNRRLQQREYRFHAPASPLLHEDLRSCPNGAALLAARYQNTTEAAGLSPQTPIRYTYTRMKMDERGDFFETGETAGAIVEQAKICHGSSFTMLQSLARRGVKWEELQQDAPLPGYVVVRPDRPVPAGSIWRLNAKAAPGCGIADSNLGPIYVNRQLSARLEQHVHAPAQGETLENQLLLRFNSLVEKEALQRAFRDMRLVLNGVETQLSEDGCTRSAVVDGQELRVRYAGALPPQRFSVLPADPERFDVAEHQEAATSAIHYAHPTAAPGMRLVVESPVPVLVECTLKSGLQGILGLQFEQDFTCRYHLTPLSPALPVEIRHTMPQQGPHHLEVAAASGSRLHLRLRYWKAGEFVKAWPHIKSHLEQQDRRSSMPHNRYLRALARACRQAGLEPVEEPAMEENVTRAWEVLQNRIFLQPAGGRMLAERDIPLGGATHSLLGVSCARLELDALCGGKPAPGMYLVEMDLHPSETLAVHLRSLGLDPADFVERRDALVSVTDLAVLPVQQSNQQTHLLVLRQGTGEPLPQGEIIPLGEEGGDPQPVEQGYANLGDWAGDVLVRSGEDCCLVSAPGAFNDGAEDASAGAPELRAMLWTDRPAYRPGDKVYVRGFLRAVDGMNRMSHSNYKTLELHFEAPDGSRLFSRTFDVDAYGAFSQELTLPRGQEEVCGNYTVRVGTTRPRTLARHAVSCQLPQREAFEVQVRDCTARVAPQELVLQVRAQDSAGMAVSNARVELRVQSSTPLRGSRPLPGGKLHELELTRQVAADGVAVFCMPFEAVPEEDFSVSYEGAVVNEREEYSRFNTQGLYTAAGVRVQLGEDDRLRLLCADCGEALGHSMTVRVSLQGKQRRESPLPNGFSVEDSEPVELWSEWVSVPAGSADGVQLPLAELVRQHTGQKPDSLVVQVMGRDAAGRVFRAAFPRKAWEMGSPRYYRMWNSSKPGHVVIETGADALVALVLEHGSRVRVHTMELQRGRHELALPLLGDEEGRVAVASARLQRDAHTGCLEVASAASCQVELPARQSALNLELFLPGTVRPGTSQQLAGRVTLPGGQPAQAVVTLYAVGTEPGQSAGAQPRPDVTAALGRWAGGALSLNHQLSQSGQNSFTCAAYSPGLLPLPGIWQGEGRMADGSWKQQPWWMQAYTGPEMPAAVAEEAAAAPATGSNPAPAVPGNPQLAPPVALWCSALRTDAEGRFSTTCTLPSVLTPYRVIAVAADKDGKRFGSQEGSFEVNQPVLLRAGTPVAMCVGDSLRVPLSVTNNTRQEGSWEVALEGNPEAQQLHLPPGATETVDFEISPQNPGSQSFRWVARGTTGEDTAHSAVEVSYPSPLLKEAHQLSLTPGQGDLQPRSLLGAELAGAPACELVLQVSANPLLFMQGAVDYLLQQPAGSLSNAASALLPWLLHDRLAPLCPRMARIPASQAGEHIERAVADLLNHQLPGGGLPMTRGGNEPCLWVSAQAAVALRMAEERGYELPLRAWYNLLAYLEKADASSEHPLVRYLVARALQDRARQREALLAALAAQPDERWCTPGVRQDIEFLEYLRTNNDGRREAFLRWMRTRAADYRQRGAWSGAWSVYTLLSYIGKSPSAPVESSLRLPDGSTATLGREVRTISLAGVDEVFSPLRGETYAVLRAQARPARLEYAGFAERGMQLTRLYEAKGADGNWHPATEFAVGDVVRVSVTCTKSGEQELQHLVLEDYLPASMEAVNPTGSSHSAGLEPLSWSDCFDQREYQASRVRGGCTRWAGSEALRLRYYARVKRPGSTTAPPAQVQLQYDPQTYALSPSARIISR